MVNKGCAKTEGMNKTLWTFTLALVERHEPSQEVCHLDYHDKSGAREVVGAPHRTTDVFGYVETSVASSSDCPFWLLLHDL